MRNFNVRHRGSGKHFVVLNSQASSDPYAEDIWYLIADTDSGELLHVKHHELSRDYAFMSLI